MSNGRSSDDHGKPSRQAVRDRIKDQKLALIQAEILGTASRLIAERGFRGVTVDDISSEMGFTKSIVYYYLKNKNEILWKLFQRIDETYARSLDDALSAGGTPKAKLANAVKAHCLNVLTNKEWSTIYNRDENELLPEQRRVVSANKRTYNGKMQQLYSEGVGSGDFRDVPPSIAVSCLLGACNWTNTWYRKDGRYSAESIAETFTMQLVHGVTDRCEAA